MDTGMMIAVQIVGLYVFLGPLVFLGLYVLFDRLAERVPPSVAKDRERLLDLKPALWTSVHVQAFFERKKRLSSLTNSNECRNRPVG